MTEELLKITCDGTIIEISKTGSGEIYIGEPYDEDEPNIFGIVISQIDWEHMKQFIDRQFSTTPKS